MNVIFFSRPVGKASHLNLSHPLTLTLLSTAVRPQRRGLAIGGWVPNIQPTSATVRLDSDGTLVVVTGAVDIAGTNMGLALIAAEAYGVDIEQVRIMTGDTDSSPLAGLSAGSKTTYTMGASVRDAAGNARQQTLAIAADPDSGRCRAGSLAEDAGETRQHLLVRVSTAYAM